MATIVNNPGGGDNSMAGLIIGLIFLAVIVGLFFIYGLPLLQNMPQPQPQPPTTIKVELPPIPAPTPAPEPTPAPTPTP